LYIFSANPCTVETFLQGRRHLTTPAAIFSVIMITQKVVSSVIVITHPEGASRHNHRADDERRSVIGRPVSLDYLQS
jgi:hypothetical protein